MLCYWEQHGDQHETEYISPSECVVLTPSALDVPEKEFSARARILTAERLLSGQGAVVGF